MPHHRMLDVPIALRSKIAVPLTFTVLACGTGGESQSDPTRQVTVDRERDQRSVVLFLGTSLTAGLGVADGESFPALIGHRLDSLGVPLRVVNAGESGGTSAGGLRRIDFLLEQHEVAVLVLELGANDGLRGLGTAEMRSNLQEIVDKTRTAYPDAELVVAGMEAPPNLGESYTDAFRAVFGEIAEENDGYLVPFLLEGVAAVPGLNQSDGIHPTAQGHEIIAENVWLVLERVMPVPN